VRELRLGDEVDVSCRFAWSGGRTGGVYQHLHRVDGGELVAELTSVGGLLDLGRRRLVEAPDEHWRRLARQPEMLGLDPVGTRPGTELR
jgi:acyl-CoA thioester hydrolase